MLGISSDSMNGTIHPRAQIRSQILSQILSYVEGRRRSKGATSKGLRRKSEKKFMDEEICYLLGKFFQHSTNNVRRKALPHLIPIRHLAIGIRHSLPHLLSTLYPSTLSRSAPRSVPSHVEGHPPLPPYMGHFVAQWDIFVAITNPHESHQKINP
jgi:hypothetical protein